MQTDSYNTIDKPSVAEYKDRGSKFLGYAFPINDTNEFKEKLVLIRKEHPKASHHCFAYRLGTDKNNFRCSDDGEPSGTAGKPILGQIDSKKLTNVVIIVARYFGGTQLGVPGLINAYRTSAALALETATIIQKPILFNYKLQFDYTVMNEVMTVVKQFNCVVFEQENGLFTQMRIGIPALYLQKVTGLFSEIKGLIWSQ